MPSSYQLWTRRSKVNYSRFIGREIGLMQKPSMIESPSGRTLEKAPRWDLTGTEGCGGGKVFSWLFLFVWGYMGIYRQKKQVGGVTRGPQGWGRALPPGCALRPCGRLVASPTSSPSLLVCFWSKKNHHGSFIPFGLRLLFLFYKTQKQGKNRNQHQALG